MMYYIGYNENFANYKEGGSLPASIASIPTTQRLRIGLKHSANESDDDRDKVEFDYYKIRIEDSNGDIIEEGEDVPTMATSYGTALTTDNDEQNNAVRKLFLYDYGTTTTDSRPTFGDKGTLLDLGNNNAIGGTGDDADTDEGPLTNVRIVDGSKITVPVYSHTDDVIDRPDARTVQPMGITNIKVGISGADGPNDASRVTGDVFAEPPDEHRDFPADTLTTDGVYTITAWAENEDRVRISPEATLKVSPIDREVTLVDSDNNSFQDYRTAEVTPSATAGTIIVTQFTVFK